MEHPRPEAQGDLPVQFVPLDRQQVIHSRRGYQALRRAQDVFFSLLAIIVLMPALLFIALLIWLDDPHGSPLFKQVRIGRDGKPFRLYKFRSMCVDAEARLDALLERNEMDGPAFKLRDDPRITRVGRFLRRTSIDELPQLINILRGDMSIVGPRPALPREVEQYTAYQAQRLIITPGLTCYWQVQPRRNSIPFEEWIELDLRYIRQRSFLVDWQIIFATIGAVVHMEGE